MKSKSDRLVGAPLALVLVALTAMIVAAPAASAQDWPLIQPNWAVQISLVGYAMGIDGTISGNLNGEPVTIDFDNITDYSNFGGSLRIEAQKDRWSIITDLQYLSVDAESEVKDPAGGSEMLPAQNTMGQAIWELTGAYLFAKNWDFLLAGRYYSFSDDLKVGDQQVLDGTHGWFDIFIGLRFRSEIWDQWLLSIRGDVGAGGSKIATYLDLRARYTFSNDKLWLEGGVRSNYEDREEGEPYFETYNSYDATTTGFFLALGYTF